MTRGPINGRLLALTAVVSIAALACGGGAATSAPARSSAPAATSAAAETSAAATSAATSAAAETTAAASATAAATSAAPSESATAAATSAAPSASATAGASSPAASGSAAPTTGSCAGAEPGPFFDQAECEEQLALRTVAAEGPADRPWEQALNPDLVDTAQYKKDGAQKVCFSNAGVNNPWRVVGYETMQAEVDIQREAGKISDFVHVDAGGDDNKQISDIQDLLANGDCGALIVSPNTTAALTPAVEQACQANIPVIVFDRGVNTDCPVTFIKPIGGYAFGADAAEFLSASVPAGGNVLALRILPGVDVLETRFSAAKAIFNQKGINLVGAEFTEGDPAKTKSIVTDYLQRGKLDGIWMDAGATSLGAIEAFEDAGQTVPPITGEDQQDFLRKWKDDGLTAMAPTYPTYQWRTAIIAAVKILAGEQVAKNWNLPQPKITADNLDQYLKPDMPDLHYALCGCETMPGFPDRWKNPAP
jgi:ribose transport system substrate-binding protein